MTQESKRIYEAAVTFDAVVDGKNVTVRRGVTRVSEGHPLLKGREQMFRELEVGYDVEQATAAPGEKRA